MQTLAGRTAVFASVAGGDDRDSVKALCAGGMNVVIMTNNVPEVERLIAEVKAADASIFRVETDCLRQKKTLLFMLTWSNTLAP